MTENEKKPNLKVILLGERSVGKTTLINKLISMQANKHQTYQTNPTIGSQFHSLSFDFGTIHIYDTSGSHNQSHFIKLHLHSCELVLLMYSVVEAATLKQLRFWLMLIEGLHLKTVLIANKIDDRFKFQKRQKELEAGKNYAKSRNYDFVEMSALIGSNIESLLNIFRNELNNKHKDIHQQTVENEVLRIGLAEEEKGCRCRCSLM